MAHAVVHFEIGGPDDGQLAEFYAGLFGWRMNPVPGSATRWSTPAAAAGSTAASREPRCRAVTFYIETDDLQAALDKVNLLGGKTELPVTELPGMPAFARFSDLDGLVVGLVGSPREPGAHRAGRRRRRAGRLVRGARPRRGPELRGSTPRSSAGSRAGRSRLPRWSTPAPSAASAAASAPADGALGHRVRERADVEAVLARAAELGGSAATARPGRRPHADRRAARPGRQRVRRVPPRPALALSARSDDAGPAGRAAAGAPGQPW